MSVHHRLFYANLAQRKHLFEQLAALLVQVQLAARARLLNHDLEVTPHELGERSCIGTYEAHEPVGRPAR